MKKIKLALFILTSILFVNNISAQKKKTALFENDTTESWRIFAQSDSISKEPPFIFDNGIIKAQGKRKAYLITKGEFKGNYKLSVDFRWVTDSTVTRRSKKRNSGIMYNVPATTPDEFWPKGFQFQLKDNATGDFIMLKETTMEVNNQPTKPGKNTISKKYFDAENVVGEWNTAEIVFQDSICSQYLNGKKINEGTKLSETQGQILLMYEGYPIEFRNIFIEQ